MGREGGMKAEFYFSSKLNKFGIKHDFVNYVWGYDESFTEDFMLTKDKCSKSKLKRLCQAVIKLLK